MSVADVFSVRVTTKLAPEEANAFAGFRRVRFAARCGWLLCCTHSDDRSAATATIKTRQDWAGLPQIFRTRALRWVTWVILDRKPDLGAVALTDS